MIHESFVKISHLNLLIFKYLTIVNFVYYLYYGYANVQCSLCAKRLHGQWHHWHLQLIRSTRQIALLTYLQDVWLISLSLKGLKFHFNKFHFQCTHVFFTFSWNMYIYKIELCIVRNQLVSCAPDKFFCEFWNLE